MAWCGTKEKNNYKNKKYHNGRTAPKYISKHHINRGKIDTLQTHICDRSLSCVGTGTSQKSDGIELVLWTTQTPRRKNIRSLKWFRSE